LTLILALAGVAAVFALFSILAPLNIIRGTAASFAVIATFVAWNPVVPANVREVVIWGASLALLLSVLSKRTWTSPKSVMPLVVFAFFGIALAITAIQNPDGFGGLLRISTLGLLSAWAASQFSPRDIRVFYGGLLVAAVIQVLFGLQEFFITHVPALWGFGVFDDGSFATYANPLFGGSFLRVQGTTGHPIPYGTLMALALVVLVAGWKYYHPVLRVIVGLLAATGLVLSGSRTSMIALVIAVCYLALLSRNSVHRVRNYFIAALIVAGVFLFDFGLSSALSELVNSGSYTNRASGIESVPGLFSRSPLDVLFGSGFGSEASLFAQGYLQQNGFNIVDNQLITTLATQGIVGFMLLVSIIIYGVVKTDRTSRALILAMAFMLFSFDYLRWPSMVCLLFLFVATPRYASDNFEYRPPVDDLGLTQSRPLAPSKA
jgi:hypothetical protein